MSHEGGYDDLSSVLSDRLIYISSGIRSNVELPVSSKDPSIESN